MRLWRTGAPALLAISLTACSGGAPPTLGIEQFGLSESAVDHPTVQAAVEAANEILGKDAKLKFVPGWAGKVPKAGVPVYAVSAADLSHEEIMSTFAECGCVVVRLGALGAWEQSHVGTGEALLDIEPRLLLAYMLLHEIGHVANGDLSGGMDQVAATAAVNLDLTAQKDREEKADAFAAALIQNGMTDASTERGLIASEVSMALTQLSYNLLEHRLLDDFGGTDLSKPALFWDRGTTHPNLEWRVLVVNNLIAPTTETQTLLQDFEARRFGVEPQLRGN